MRVARVESQEIVRRGEELYGREIRSKVEAGNEGKVLVLDIETGEYEIAEDDLTATERMRKRRPLGVLYGLRIGHPAVYRLGGQPGSAPNG